MRIEIRKLFSLSIVFLIVFGSFAFPVLAQQAVPLAVTRSAWGSLANPVDVYAGVQGVGLVVEIQNLSPYQTINGVSGMLVFDASPFTDAYGNLNATASGVPSLSSILNPTDQVAPRGFLTMTFSIDISDGAVPGKYLLDLRLNYSVQGGDSFAEGLPQTLQVSCVISPTGTTVAISVFPAVLNVGEGVRIGGAIQPAVENAIVNLSFEDPQGNRDSKVAKTNLNGSFVCSYYPNVDGLWGVNASWAGNGNYSGNWVTGSFEVRLPVSLSLSVSNSRLIAGFDNSLNVTLTNDCAVAVSGVQVAFTVLPPLMTIGKTQWFFNYLGAGASVAIPVVVFAPVSALGGTFSCSLNVNSRDDYGTVTTRNYPVGLAVVRSEDIGDTSAVKKPSVSLLAAPPRVDVGEQVKLSGVIQPAVDNAIISLVFEDPAGNRVNKSVSTSLNGSFEYSYYPTVEGLWIVNASWPGSSQKSGNWGLASFEVRLPVSLDLSVSNNKLRAGSESSFNVTITNNCNVVLSALEFALTVPPPLSSTGKNQWSLDLLSPGKSFSMPVSIFAPAVSIGGTYSCGLSVACLSDDAELKSFSFPVGLVVVGGDGLGDSIYVRKPTILLSVFPQVVNVGEGVKINGAFQPAVANANVSLVFEDPKGNRFSGSAIAKLDGSFDYSYNPEIEGTWTVNASWLGDSEHLGSWGLTSFQVRLPTSLDTRISNNRLKAGYDSSFNITVVNTCEVAFSALQLTLTVPPPLSSTGKNQWSLDSLSPGESFSMPVTIFAPAASIGGTFKAALTVACRDSYGGLKSFSFPVDLVAVGDIDLGVYSHVVEPKLAFNGTKISVTMTVLNRGTVSASYVNASILPNPVLTLTEQSVVYIGDIEENSQTPFALEANVSKDAATGVYPVTAIFFYKDDQNFYNSFSYTFSVSVLSVYVEPAQAKPDTLLSLESPSLWAVVLVVCISVSMALIVRYRKLRKRRSLGSMGEINKEKD